MKERELRDLIADVKTGRLSRRAFVQQMIAVGLTAPMAGMMLSHSGVAMAATAIPYKPTKAGGGGLLKLLYWQAVTLLNPHFAVGTKDQEGSRIFYEPLAGWDNDGNLVPVLAAEIPSKENNGLTEDGLSVVWKLKQGVKWHDGKPFTADDVVFNWEYARTPETAAVSIASYKDIKVEKIDDFTVRGKLNPNYHLPNRPYFDTIEIKGGGDAVSAARAVLQTGEYDYAWNMQVEDDILKRLEQSGKGRIDAALGGNIEHIQLNQTDPWTEVEGEKSSIKTRHPFLTDLAVRQALNLLVDRGAVQEQIYGRTGIATANFL